MASAKGPDLVRASAAQLPAVADPTGVRTARVWYCKYRTLAPLAQLSNLEVLLLAGIPDPDLGFLQGLARLRHLAIIHMPKIRSLEPIGSLKRLRVLSLATSPGWDASGKVLEVAFPRTARTLASPRAARAVRCRVAAENARTAHCCRSLRSVRVSKYPEREVAALRQATGARDERIAVPEPW